MLRLLPQSRSIPIKADTSHAAIGIERAHATLRHAARFMREPEALRFTRAGYASKVLGNSLRELDRFLSVLIDEVAACADFDGYALNLLRTRRNTANKLRMLHDTLGHDSPDHHRLLALGRSRDCLYHCGGQVLRADTRSGCSMTAGWPIQSSGARRALATQPLGSRLQIDQRDIGDICRFYDRIADDLLSTSHILAERRAAAKRHPVAFSYE